MAAVTVRPLASDAGIGTAWGLMKINTPKPITTRNSVPRASADARARSRVPREEGADTVVVMSRDSFVRSSGGLLRRRTLRARQEAVRRTAFLPRSILSSESGRFLNPSLAAQGDCGDRSAGKRDDGHGA